MFLPDVFKRFSKEFPKIAKATGKVRDLCAEAGPLDEKTKHLVQMGIGIGAGSKGGVRSHARQAMLAGATKEEILHAVVIATSTIGFPLMIASYEWVQEVLDGEDESEE